MLNKNVTSNVQDEEGKNEDLTFPRKRIESAVKVSTSQIIKQDTKYDYKKSQQWMNDVVELTMKKLCNLSIPYKFVVMCLIIQNNGAGFHVANSASIEPYSDGLYSYKMETQGLYVVTSVYAFSI